MASLHDEAYARFVEMLVDRRKAAKLSQQKVADQLGWHQSVIAKIEKRERRIDVIELVRVAAVIGFDAAKLVRDVRAMMIEEGEIT